MGYKDSLTTKSDIGCIIVTFNRLEKLKKTLRCYAMQSILPDYVIVVNNASTDGTAKFLQKWKQIDEGFEKIIINSSTNLGGSGGFYLGEKEAINLSAKWIMIADDDAYPEKNYLKGMYKYICNCDENLVSIVCGKVIQHGDYVNFHRGQWKTKWDKDFYTGVQRSEYDKKVFYPDFVSYVGILINKLKMQEVGLVNKDNFIWHDDIEHTYRLSQKGKIVCLPEYSMLHDVDDTHDGISWKSYYGYRNALFFFKKHFPGHYPFILGKLFIKSILAPLRGRSFTEIRLRFAAMKDCVCNHMGKNEVYKPGWKP